MPATVTQDAIAFVGLMPHAPILVPGVGHQQHHQQANRTIRAMEALARHAVATLPDAVVVISPHSPQRAGAFGIWDTALLRGSFSQFGVSDSGIELPLDQAFSRRLIAEALALGLKTWNIVSGTIDYGASVPLSYLRMAGWSGPTVIVGVPDSGHEGLEKFGRAIVATAEALGRRVAVIASGDMSHRLTATSPGGFHADGQRFDETFIALVRSGATAEIARLAGDLVENAGEDVTAAMLVAIGVAGQKAGASRVLSYEGPFGVGYGVAILVENPRAEFASGTPPPNQVSISHPADLPIVARCAVEARLTGAPVRVPFSAAGNLRTPRGLFVTIRTANGSLRGCWGAPVPTERNVVEETWHCARSAAFNDPRFPNLRDEELRQVHFSVSLLHSFEQVSAIAELDPLLYGIYVESIDGRTSVILPGVKGITSGAEQLRVAKRKGAIDVAEPVTIRKFAAETYHEPPSQEKGE